MIDHNETKKRPGGSAVGRLTYRSKTKVPGIRFDWVNRTNVVTLVVVATWTDALGKARRTSFSTETQGLEGALDAAIKARTSAGAPVPDRERLLAMLRVEYATKSTKTA